MEAVRRSDWPSTQERRNRGIETRNQRALRGMVQVGLARPDGTDDLVVFVQLVEPRTVLMVDQVFVNVLPEGRNQSLYTCLPVTVANVAEVFTDSASVSACGQ